MPATREQGLIHWSRASQRDAVATALRLTERGVAEIRRNTEQLLYRAQMHLRAWREAVDPSTAGWIVQAKVDESAARPDEIRDELERRIAEVRKLS
jgi:hypothetical protein